MKHIGRRGFLRSAAGAALGAGFANAYNRLGQASTRSEVGTTMPTRRLGKTGYQVSLFSLGGMSTIMDREKSAEAAAIVHRALDLGVNYIDTADTYRDGDSELNIGEVLRDRREEVFLATKTRQRTADGLIARQFDTSLERLQTDFLDLYFAHGVHTLEDLDTFLDRKTGGILAFEQLREQGRLGHIGISSHSSATMMAAMERYPLDVVFITVNPAGLSMNDPENLRDMLAMAQDRDMGVVGMKVIARGNVFERGVSMEEALRYTLSLPIATAVVGITQMEQLEENVRLARGFAPLDEAALARLESSAKSA